MPYKIVHKFIDGIQNYGVMNLMTKRIHGWTTKDKANAQLRLLYAIDNGFIPNK
jgi:hypothetical protein